MLRDIPLKVLLVAGFLVSGLIPLMAVALSSLSTARVELTAQAFRQLESVRDLKRSQLERFFDERARHARLLTSNPAVQEALRELRPAASVEERRAVSRPYADALGAVAAESGFQDILLLLPGSGDAVYSADSRLARDGAALPLAPPLDGVWRTAVREGRVALSDTRPYRPIGGTPVQFIAAPVVQDGRLLGVLAGRLSAESINAIMRERSGMGLTGETYLVGNDNRMRSDSFLDPVRRSVSASFAGTVEQNGADTEATREALQGRSGSRVLLDYRGRAVLSAYALVRFYGVEWALVAEIDENEIEQKIASALDTKIGVIIGLSIVLLLLLALSISQFVSRSVQNVNGELRRLVDKVLQGELRARGVPEDMAFDFRGVMRKTNALIAALVEQTEEKRRLEEVVQYNQRMESIGTLAGGIAHDFNNILTYMVTYADLVQRQLPDGSQAAEHMEEIVSGIDRASDLVSQIMLFGRQMKREKRAVRVALLVKEAVKLLKATIPKSIKVELRVIDEDVLLMADPTQFHQVVMNLCTNSFHAMQDTGGLLSVALERVTLGEDDGGELPPGTYCRLTVADDGCGMDEVTLSRMFEPFYTTKPVGQGTGMGLAVVHGIVTHSGGAIVFDSAVSKGTIAEVYWPIPVEPLVVPPFVERGEPVRGEGHLLVVDDEEAICRSTQLMLESLGYTVETFVSAPAALRRFRDASADFALVLTDLSMPDMDGVELTRRMRALREEVPIVMTTGFSDRMTPDKARRHGAAALLIKPYGALEVSRVLHEALRGEHGAV